MAFDPTSARLADAPKGFDPTSAKLYEAPSVEDMGKGFLSGLAGETAQLLDMIVETPNLLVKTGAEYGGGLMGMLLGGES